MEALYSLPSPSLLMRYRLKHNDQSKKRQYETQEHRVNSHKSNIFILLLANFLQANEQTLEEFDHS
jgi:hypothetical protein